jgi:hypothetical protein
MRLYTNIVLTLIALLLAVLAITAIAAPDGVRAAAGDLYIEPGTTMLRSPDGLRQVIGKVVVNLETGDIWGFPTLTGEPYPIDSTSSKPPVSTPMYLGRFDFSAMNRVP